jgi:hypothetical protein
LIKQAARFNAFLYKRGYLIAYLIVACCYGYTIWAFWWSALPYGSHDPLWNVLLVLPAMLLVMIAFPILIVMDCFKDAEKRNWKHIFFHSLVYASILLLMIYCGPLKIGWKLRMNGMQQYAARMRPIVEAIKAFDEREGHPPDNLEQLVPHYLEKLPVTGLNSNREARYENLLKAPETSRKYHGQERWLIKTRAGWGLGFDYLFYYPDQNYPENNSAGRVERVADWAYLHE